MSAHKLGAAQHVSGYLTIATQRPSPDTRFPPELMLSGDHRIRLHLAADKVANKRDMTSLEDAHDVAQVSLAILPEVGWMVVAWPS